MEGTLAGESADRRAPGADADAGYRAAVLPCVLAWVVPGAGHFYLGRRVRGVAFFAIVVVTFTLGLVLDGRAYLADRAHPLTYLATFANAGLGPMELIERKATYGELVWRLPPGRPGQVVLDRMRRRVRSGTSEYGTTFLLTAGLMNILLILDAYDVATGRKAEALEDESPI